MSDVCLPRRAARAFTLGLGLLGLRSHLRSLGAARAGRQVLITWHFVEASVTFCALLLSCSDSQTVWGTQHTSVIFAEALQPCSTISCCGDDAIARRRPQQLFEDFKSAHPVSARKHAVAGPLPWSLN